MEAHSEDITLKLFKEYRDYIKQQLDKLRTEFSLGIRQICDELQPKMCNVFRLESDKNKDYKYGCCDQDCCERIKNNLEYRNIDFIQYIVKSPPRGILFMGPNGCTVPPRHRAMCADYLCDNAYKLINSEELEKMREEIDDLQKIVFNLNYIIENFKE